MNLKFYTTITKIMECPLIEEVLQSLETQIMGVSNRGTQLVASIQLYEE